jgi:23S rRNA (cytosine1962-C5)-methyltransferase
MASVFIKHKGKETILRRHPWLFSGAVAKVDGEPESGETVEIRTSDGQLRGRGAYSPHSQIAVRVWTFDPEEEVSGAFFQKRLERALTSRSMGCTEADDTCGRLVYAESDGLPGLIVDRYSDYLVCQFLAAGTEYWKPVIVDLLKALAPGKGIYERSDVGVRDKEGLSQAAGTLWGQEPPDLIDIREGGCRFLVDVKGGHKTGFYLDQRENRARIGRYVKGAEVLDCFAYTGGFSIAALKAGATSVTSLDSSAKALQLIQGNIDLNGMDPGRAKIEEGNAFEHLRRYRDSRRLYDAIILDPPKFAESRYTVHKASRAYKDINLLACKLLRPGGVLITFSCSQHVDLDMFQKTVAFAALDAQRDVQVLEWLHQASDHPVALNFPESNYLKGLICRVW